MGPASAQTDARLPQPKGGIGTMLGLRVAKINKFRDYICLWPRVFAPDFRIRPSVLAAYGGVCSFDPPPHPRQGGGVGGMSERTELPGRRHMDQKIATNFSAVLLLVEKNIVHLHRLTSL